MPFESLANAASIDKDGDLSVDEADEIYMNEVTI